MTAESPIISQRKVPRGELAAGCPVHRTDDGVWQVHDFATAREILRSTDTLQAGFRADQAQKAQKRMRLPVLYRDGTEHREHRRQTAKYFTPRRVDTAYRSLMERLADEQIAALRRRGEADLSQLSFELAVAVTAEVMGLTEGAPGMPRRLDRFFMERSAGLPLIGWLKGLWSSTAVAMFYYRDVRPSVRARRRERRDDLISHLIDEGCTDAEILGECVTFGAAGMATTREFITVAAWHLLTDGELRTAYTTGTEPQRVAILQEILRLEPVVFDLFRRTTADIAVPGAVIPAGAFVEVGVAAANVDPEVVGARADQVCPNRPLAAGVREAVLSFGDGPHRCPGEHVAIQETDIFLKKLFALPGLRMVTSPTVGARAGISSYEVTNLRIAVD